MDKHNMLFKEWHVWIGKYISYIYSRKDEICIVIFISAHLYALNYGLIEMAPAHLLSGRNLVLCKL